MNILIDYTQIPLQRAGVGIYAYNLVLELTKRDTGNHFFLLVQDDDPSFDGIFDENVTLIRVRSRWFRKFHLRVVLEQVFIPWLAWTLSLDVVHSLHYSFPLLCPAKNVVTVPDMTFFLFPELHVQIKVLFFRLFIRLTSRLADKVICISDASCIDYLARFKRASDRVVVIPLGKAKEYNATIDAGAVAEIKTKYGIVGEYLLFIGTIEPRKNIVRLVNAYRLLVEEGMTLQLVITGKKGWHYDEVFSRVEESGLSDRVIFTGYIDELEKPILLSGAKVFVYPSLYEGFGLPVLEALACGIPTVTSNVSAMPEVAGDAAMLVNPEDSLDIYGGIRTLLTDAATYRLLQERSHRQAAQFSWERTARETLEVYRQIGKDAKNA